MDSEAGSTWLYSSWLGRQRKIPRTFLFCKHVLSHLWPSQSIQFSMQLHFSPAFWNEMHLSPHSEVVSWIIMYAPQTDMMTEAVRLAETRSLLNFRGHKIRLEVTLSASLLSFRLGNLGTISGQREPHHARQVIYPSGRRCWRSFVRGRERSDICKLLVRRLVPFTNRQ